MIILLSRTLTFVFVIHFYHTGKFQCGEEGETQPYQNWNHTPPPSINIKMSSFASVKIENTEQLFLVFTFYQIHKFRFSRLNLSNEVHLCLSVCYWSFRYQMTSSSAPPKNYTASDFFLTCHVHKGFSNLSHYWIQNFVVDD